MDDLYQQEILEHFKNPQNYGPMEKADIVVKESNASCGDKCTYYLKLSNDKKKIQDITFTGTGCAISKAVSSMLTEYVKGKTLEEAKSLNQNLIEDMIGTKVTISRQKCLMLAARALSRIHTSKIEK